jgi:hypothetical protein
MFAKQRHRLDAVAPDLQTSSAVQVFDIQFDQRRSLRFPVNVPIHFLRSLFAYANVRDLCCYVSDAVQVGQLVGWLQDSKGGFQKKNAQKGMPTEG